MENEQAADRREDPSPLFTAYRRGYDPDQVDRFVADQSRRLDEAINRASEAERKLAAAVGQLRELHRRVAMLENEERTAAPPGIDAIGERIQRILQEAWDGAFSMRQAAESDAAQIRERALNEAEAIVAAARAKADAVGEELNQRRERFMQRVDAERSKAVNQITYLSGQRKLALSELTKIRSLIDATVEEFEDKPVHHESAPSRSTEPAAPVARTVPQPGVRVEHGDGGVVPELRPLQYNAPRQEIQHPQVDSGGLARTMPVHRLPEPREEVEHDAAALVRSHRAAQAEASSATVHEFDPDRRKGRPALFDFEQGGANSDN